MPDSALEPAPEPGPASAPEQRPEPAPDPRPATVGPPPQPERRADPVESYPLGPPTWPMTTTVPTTVTPPSRPLNATAASLLGFLHEGPMTGWDLLAAAENRIGVFWSLTQSQVYRELAAMAQAGLVEAGERGRRDRQPYTITAAGRAAFMAWATRDPGQETIRFPLLLAVMFGRNVPSDRLAWYIANHRRAHAARLAAFERQREELPAGAAESEPYAVATLDFGLAYERAVLAWFDSLPPAVSGHCARG